MTYHLDLLRQAGFFKDYQSLSNEGLVNALKQKRKEEYTRLFGYEYEPEDHTYIVEFLAQDNKKCLHIDMEADVCNGNNVYIGLLEDFSKASNGYFVPLEIKETWDSEEGPITISFSSDKQQIVFEPEYLDDWIDGGIIEVINNEMRKVCNESFVVCSGPNDEWFGQDIVYMRLAANEMQLLKDKLGWNFSEA